MFAKLRMGCGWEAFQFEGEEMVRSDSRNSIPNELVFEGQRVYKNVQ